MEGLHHCLHEHCVPLVAGGPRQAPTGGSGAVGSGTVTAANCELPQVATALLAAEGEGW